MLNQTKFPEIVIFNIFMQQYDDSILYSYYLFVNFRSQIMSHMS